MTRRIYTGIAATAAALMTFSAHAADKRVVYYKAAPAAVGYSWTGCYLGGQLGGQWTRWTGDLNYPGDAFGHPAIAASREFDGNGNFIYGGQLGCNWQAPGSAFVLGAEGDVIGVNRSSFGGELARFPALTTDHFNTSGSYGTQYSARLKAGLAFDRVLIYVAGGASWANLSATHSFLRDGDGSLAVSTSTTRSGWNLGIGADFALANCWVLGVEYRYTDYGSMNFNVPAGTAGTLSWTGFTVSADSLRTQDARLRLSYRFGSTGVVTKY